MPNFLLSICRGCPGSNIAKKVKFWLHLLGGSLIATLEGIQAWWSHSLFRHLDSFEWHEHSLWHHWRSRSPHPQSYQNHGGASQPRPMRPSLPKSLSKNSHSKWWTNCTLDVQSLTWYPQRLKERSDYLPSAVYTLHASHRYSRYRLLQKCIYCLVCPRIKLVQNCKLTLNLHWSVYLLLDWRILEVKAGGFVHCQREVMSLHKTCSCFVASKRGQYLGATRSDPICWRSTDKVAWRGGQSSNSLGFCWGTVHSCKLYCGGRVFQNVHKYQDPHVQGACSTACFAGKIGRQHSRIC